MYYVYVIKSLRTGEFYKGLTSNLEKRLHDHALGKTVSTRFRLPIELVHVELCETREIARNLEKYFKSGFGREIIAELAQIYQ